MPSKYSSQDRRKEFVRPYKIHPIWRGIGFLLMLLVPIMSWAGAMEISILGRQQGWGFLRELGTSLRLPDILYKLPVISSFANWVSSIYDLPILLMLFVVLMLVFSGVMSLLYSMIFRLVGPPRYTSMDAPASKAKIKRYTR